MNPTRTTSSSPRITTPHNNHKKNLTHNNTNNKSQAAARTNALKDANAVKWNLSAGFNPCCVVLTTHHHHHTQSSSAAEDTFELLFETLVNNYDDNYELGINWDEELYTKRELPPHFRGLDLSSVEHYVKRGYEAAQQFDRYHSFSRHSSSHDHTIGGVEGDDSSGSSEISSNGIPKFFFDTNFDLTDAKVFDQVLEYSDCDDQIQLDQLTSYLDVVETLLHDQVRGKSKVFLQETNRFHSLKEVITDSSREVKDLLGNITQIKQDFSILLNEIPKLSSRRENLKIMQGVLDAVFDITVSIKEVSGLIASFEYMSAITTIEQAQNAFNETLELDGVEVHLSKLKALSDINHKLKDYESLVINELCNQLIGLFLDWKSFQRLHLDSKNSSSSIGMKVAKISKRFSQTTMNPNEKEAKELIEVLCRCKELPLAATLYSSRLCDLLKETIKTTINECAVDAGIQIETSSDTNDYENDEDIKTNSPNEVSIAKIASSMTFSQFINCLDLLFDELMTFLEDAVSVAKFLEYNNINMITNSLDDKDTSTENNASNEALNAATELSNKTVAELLRLRKDAHVHLSFDEMQRLWDSSLDFTLKLESFSGTKAFAMRSTLLMQAKAFVEKSHENHLATLVSALDSEKWVQVDVSVERQTSIHNLCAGRAAARKNTSKSNHITELYSNAAGSTNNPSRKEYLEAEVDGSKYKVVWSCLLLVEMIITNIKTAAQFQTLAPSLVRKMSELLRLFNSRTTHLVLGAGARQSAAKLKHINAKHLSLVTHCLGLVISLLPHVRAGLMAQLPPKQHSLLSDLDRVKKDMEEHNEKVLNKFVSIVEGIIERDLTPLINKTDFDLRVAESDKVECCPFLDGIVTNTKKMYQVLSSLLKKHHLVDVFSRIYASIDQKVPTLFTAASGSDSGNSSSEKTKKSAAKFYFPISKQGKRRMVDEVKLMVERLNEFEGIEPWTFNITQVLETHLGIEHEVFIQKGVNNDNCNSHRFNGEAGKKDDGENITTNNEESGDSSHHLNGEAEKKDDGKNLTTNNEETVSIENESIATDPDLSEDNVYNNEVDSATTPANNGNEIIENFKPNKEVKDGAGNGVSTKKHTRPTKNITTDSTPEDVDE